ncbi:RXT2-like protein [Xylariales sp. AK1849]|nr:RXT2-like protein [Xylariales sp. AK1849]
MASQQALFADTLIAMKKAMKRKAYESDSDDVDYRGNRGQKLKRRARFVREGRLAPPSGPDVYREVVNHAGYSRAIISRNPPLVDDEGYEPESDDEDYEQRMQDIIESVTESNPYASVRLESILAPLTAVTDLPSHPTLSRPYTSKTLTDLTVQARNIMQKENTALWNVKHLHTKLVGDHVWVPCELMETSNDIDFYQDQYLTDGMGKGSINSDPSLLLLENARAGHSTNGQSSVNGEGGIAINEERILDKLALGDADTSMADADTTANDTTIDEDATNDESRPNTDRSKEGNLSEADKATDDSSKTAVEELRTNGFAKPAEPNGQSSSNHALQRALNGNDMNRTASGPMSTVSNLDTTDEFYIHPLFLHPRSALPNRDLGIPETEAEDLRRLLQLWVQKQEEVCRGAKRLNEGLLRADRLRKTVLQWSKYEAHVGPNRDMSDGEDWYDKEEWGLEEDLKKGQDEEEEDTVQATKKTRARR